MIDEYIKREDALKAVTYVGTAEPTDIIPLTLLTAQKNIRKIPSADVVPVVRCKECEYWDAVKNPKHAGTGICQPPNPSIGGYCTRRGATKADDFCSYGRRKYEISKTTDS